MGSRGSVIPLFIEQLQQGRPLTITDPAMTRFMMTLDDAVNLVLHAFANGDNGDIFVQKAPASTIEMLARALLQVLGRPDHPISVIGTRHGEKLYETLLSREEMAAAQDLDRYFRVPPDLRDLNYEKFIERGERRISSAADYNSHNTQQLSLESLKGLLQQLGMVQDVQRGQPARAAE